MYLPTRYHQLTRDARAAQLSGRFREGAVLREQARQITLQHGALRQAFYSGTWAAMSWELAGEPLRALHLLTELLADIPSEAVSYDVAFAREEAFEISRTQNPRLGSLVPKLDELEQKPGSSVTGPNLHWFRARLFESQGLWSRATEHFELGWARHNDRGFARYIFGEPCLNLNLRLGRRPAAGRWCELLGRTETALTTSRAAWYSTRVRLALWDQESLEAEIHARDMEDAGAGLQYPLLEQTILEMRVRTLLLDPARGDPLNARHPARRQLAARLSGKPQMETIYDRRLLHGDYRLAALRWLVGIPPVDDLYYTRSQAVPRQIKITDRSEFQRRVTHVRRAYRSAMIRAEDLDERWECDWRRKQVDGRLERLEEIVRAAA